VGVEAHPKTTNGALSLTRIQYIRHGLDEIAGPVDTALRDITTSSTAIPSCAAPTSPPRRRCSIASTPPTTA
jgi:hypothetical protein